MNNNTRIMDLECNPNYFLAAFMDNEDKIEYFEVIDTPEFKINQLVELQAYMKDKQYVGYNVLEYDSQLIEKIFDLLDEGVEINNNMIYELSQDVINAGRPSKWEWQLRHKWLDLMAMNNWNAKSARKASLKWLQYSTDQNILDLPYKFDQVLNLDQIKEVKDYCIYSDIPATKKIYEKCFAELALRHEVGTKENLNLLNAAEPKMARELFSKHLSEKMGITKKELKELKTLDVPFRGKDVLLPYIEFKDPIFKKIHEDFKNARLFEDCKFKRKVTWKGLHIDYGLGGIHSFREPKVWEENNDYVIIDSDISSFYPNLTIKNYKKPRHLGNDFSEIYEGYYIKRKSIPKKDPMNQVFKLIINSAYGQFLDKYSFLFDRQLGMFITLNGQLLLTMFMEMISEVAHPINCNTDGVISMVKKDKVDRYYEICKEWEKLTKLEFEHEDYSKYISWDINNFIGITKKGESKCKGRFEFQPMIDQKVAALHKNKSELIVAKAIHDYFVFNTPIEDTIYNHDNIFDFCIGERAQWDSHFENISIKSDTTFYTKDQKIKYVNDKGYFEFYGLYKKVEDDYKSGLDLNDLFEFLLSKDNYIFKEKLSKTIRYYISNKGGVFKKVYDDGREQFCTVHPQKGRTYHQTLFNKIVKKPMNEYDIDYSYYLKQCRKEIDTFNINQTSLI